MNNEINVIIYASDTRKGSRKAFHIAIQEAVRHQAEIIYVHAVDKINSITPEASQSFLPKSIEKNHSDRHKSTIVTEVKKRIKRFIASAEFSSLDSVPSFSIKIQFGSPEEVILNAAKQYKAGMIVMGNREVSALSRVFLGSTAHKVLQNSAIPVLIVPLMAEKGDQKNQ